MPCRFQRARECFPSAIDQELRFWPKEGYLPDGPKLPFVVGHNSEGDRPVKVLGEVVQS